MSPREKYQRAALCIWYWTFPILVSGCGSLTETVPENESPSSQRLDVQLPNDLRLPRPEDWVDRGEVIVSGPADAWDHLLVGGFAGSVIKKDGSFYLYYQGARSYDQHFGTVTDRAIGVAISSDGFKFRKHPSNPVIRWQPNGWLEEGAVSSAPVLDASNTVWMYYGANTRLDDWNVNADARLAFSTDGITFADTGVVLDQGDGTVWGSGDELFPITAVEDEGNVLLYYLPNGTGRRGSLGVARIASLKKAIYSAEVDGPNSEQLGVWGMGSSVGVAPGVHLLFLNREGERCIEARVMETSIPNRVTAPLVEYCFNNMSSGTVFFDKESGTWLLYYRTRDGSSYRVQTASSSKLPSKIGTR